MTYCKVYCEVPPESVDKCEMLRPQLVRIRANARKVINFKMFDTCSDILESSINNSSGIIINLANRFVPNLSKRVTSPNKVYWNILDNSGIVKYSSESTINQDNTFSINIPKLSIGSGYYSLSLSRFGEYSDSICSIKLFVCA